MFKVGDKVRIKCIIDSDATVHVEYDHFVGLTGQIKMFKETLINQYRILLENGLEREFKLEEITHIKKNKLPKWF